MHDDGSNDDVRDAVLRLAGEIATVRQTMTDQSVEVINRIEAWGGRCAALEDRLTEVELTLRSLEDRVTSQPAGPASEPARLEATTVDGTIRAEALVARVGDAVRDVLSTETAVTRQRIREALDAQSDRDERTIGAGLTRLAQRVGEEISALRHELLQEIESWFEELPSETRLRDISDRLEDLAESDREV